MRLSIDIAQDEQFRNEIRNIIDSQVRSIVREELTSCVREYFEQQTTNGNTKLHTVLLEIVRRLVSEYVTPGYYSTRLGLTNLIKSIVQEQVNAVISSGEFTLITQKFEVKKD